MKNITKVFPGIVALVSRQSPGQARRDTRDLWRERGGKSTLINILCGVHPTGTYSGEIYVEGENCSFSKTSDAEKKKIVCIHQELELIPELSVAENMFLGNYPIRLGVIKWDKINYDAKELLKKVGLADAAGSEIAFVNEKVKNLGIGQQQLIEIAKALARDAKIIIFDEPTAALSENETDNLLEIIVGLRERGITCIYISHRLDEVMRIADRVTILRDGKSIRSDSIANLTKNDIVSLMVGRELTSFFPKRSSSRRAGP